MKGFRLVEESNTCVPCGVSNCAKCIDDTQCRECMPGYGLANPQDVEGYSYKAATTCHACAKADPNCFNWYVVTVLFVCNQPLLRCCSSYLLPALAQRW